ncbi:MAG TPA: sugar phosphate isomerase/epimerase family protein [Pirellulales bacterium]|jgi:sugar phosphate isomerase/epimerase|nr:sugar phosphate isomerase/epimerase family protein [Pirellulales bacterium]
MLLAYNTNGLAHHDPIEAIELLAEIGYRGVGLTIDHGLLSPRDRAERHRAALQEFQRALRQFGMRSVVETGARFLLDPRQKHEPTLMTADPERRKLRVEFLRYAIRTAAELQSDCVSIWSGILRNAPNEASFSDAAAFERLIDGLAPVCDYASRQGVIVAFEPEPGMFIDTMDRFEQLLARFDHPALRLTIDLGHLHCQGETPIGEQLRRWASRLVNVHIEDMRAGVHEHLMFGEGEIEFPPIFAALREIDYRGLVQVELSRHSHEGPSAGRRAMEFLRPMLPPTG